jgi:hypothetical protein
MFTSYICFISHVVSCLISASQVTSRLKTASNTHFLPGGDQMSIGMVSYVLEPSGGKMAGKWAHSGSSKASSYTPESMSNIY